MLFTGDLLPHSPVVRAAAIEAEGSDREHDFRPLFSNVVDRISSADLAICHLETPLTTDLSRLSGYPRFNAPVSLVDDLIDIGYDACSTSSNHVLDQRLEGAIETASAFEQAGLGQTGISITEEDAKTPIIYDAANIKVGHISATFSTNGMPIPSQAPWLIFDLEIDPLINIANETRAAGADFIVLSLHWGVEYQSAPTKEQRSLAESLLRNENIDLIVGHHAHVIQPVGMVDNEYVIYGVGNFLSNQSASCCAVGAQDGVIVEVELVESHDGVHAERVLVTPTRVARYGGYQILDVGNSLVENPDSNELISSWERTLERLNAESLGAFSPIPTTSFSNEP